MSPRSVCPERQAASEKKFTCGRTSKKRSSLFGNIFSSVGEITATATRKFNAFYSLVNSSLSSKPNQQYIVPSTKAKIIRRIDIGMDSFHSPGYIHRTNEYGILNIDKRPSVRPSKPSTLISSMQINDAEILRLESIDKIQQLEDRILELESLVSIRTRKSEISSIFPLISPVPVFISNSVVIAPELQVATLSVIKELPIFESSIISTPSAPNNSIESINSSNTDSNDSINKGKLVFSLSKTSYALISPKSPRLPQ